MKKRRLLAGAVAVLCATAVHASDIRVRISPGITCQADVRPAAAQSGYNHCLQGQRFSVSFTTVFALNSAAWKFGQCAGAPGQLWHTDSTIAYWLFSPDNVEALVKILDGRDVNGHWWLDFAVMSDQLTRTAIFPNDSTPTDPGPGDGWWIWTGPARRFGIQGSEKLMHCARPMNRPDRHCAVIGFGTTISLRDAWNADGSIPVKHYR